MIIVRPSRRQLTLDLPDILHIAQNPLQHLQAELRMGELSTPKHHGDLHLVTVLKESSYVPSLELVVVLLYPGPVLHLLNVHRVLLLSGFSGLTRLLVPELPIVHQAADWGPSIGRDFDKIQLCFGGPLSGLVERNDPDLLPLGIDESDWADPNLVVDTDALILDGGLPPVSSGTCWARSHKKNPDSAGPITTRGSVRLPGPQVSEPGGAATLAVQGGPIGGEGLRPLTSVLSQRNKIGVGGGASRRA